MCVKGLVPVFVPGEAQEGCLAFPPPLSLETGSLTEVGVNFLLGWLTLAILLFKCPQAKPGVTGIQGHVLSLHGHWRSTVRSSYLYRGCS